MIAMRTTPPGVRALQLLGVAVAYYFAAELGLRVAVIGDDVTPLWPPTGVAVVALLAFGIRIWPVIALAALAVNLPLSPDVAAAALIAAGNTIAPIVAVLWLDRVGFDIRLERVRDATAIVFLGALLSMAISATIGSLVLLLSDGIDQGDFAESWVVWWAGDAMGVLIVAPFLWSLRVWWPPRRPAVRWQTAVEGVVLFSVLLAATAVAVRTELPFLFLVLPVLGWIAWRFQQTGAAPAALIVSLIVTWAAAHDHGPFAGESLFAQMLVLLTFNASVAFTALLFASVVAQHEGVIERDLIARDDLYQREHRVAGTLQRSLLPARLPDALGLDVAARYIPASHEVSVGGDWYDIIPLSEGRLGLVIGDVAGHGVSAAATMGQIRMALRAYAIDDVPPDQALARLNRLMRELQPDAMATVVYGHLDPVTRILKFANAGHVPPLLIRGPHDARFIEDGHAPPVGATDAARYRETSIWFDPGATLLLYTDGLVERRTVAIDERLTRLRRAAGEIPTDLDAACDHLIDALLDEAPADDVAVLAVRPVPLVGTRLELRNPALPGTVAGLRHSVGRWLAQNGVGEAIAFEIQVATTEAYTNAVQHAYGVAEGSVGVGASIENGVLTITVNDGGTWKEPRVGHDGCGLMLMRTLMDSVEVSTHAEGTDVKMTRVLRGDQ